MSKASWNRCPKTGIPLAQLARVDETHLDVEGNFDTAELRDCNLFSINSIAAECAFRDVAYFRHTVLPHPDCRIHVHRRVLRDSETGQFIAEVIATHQNSATIGGIWWHRLQSDAARKRAQTDCQDPTDTSSGQVILRTSVTTP